MTDCPDFPPVRKYLRRLLRTTKKHLRTADTTSSWSTKTWVKVWRENPRKVEIDHAGWPTSTHLSPWMWRQMWARNFSKLSELFPGQTSCLRWWTQTLSRCRTARWRMWVEKYRAIIANCWEVRPRPLQLRDVIVRNLRSPTVLSLTTARFSVWSTGHLLRLRISQLRLIQVWRNRSSRREYRNTTMTSRITSRTIQRVTSPEPDWVGIVGVWQQKMFLIPWTGVSCARQKLHLTQPLDIVSYVRWRSSSSCSNQEMQLSTCGRSSSATAGTRRGISSEDHEKKAKTFIYLWLWYLLFHLRPPILICVQYHCDETVLGPQFPLKSDLVLRNKFVWKLNKLWFSFWWQEALYLKT